MKRILLLSDEAEVPDLATLFRDAVPDCGVSGVSDRDKLEQATRDAGPDLRLVAFCTDVIVPADILARLSGPAYNFHPGPPGVRGVYPAVFAIYEGMTRFGATLHELTEEVDAGPIVAVDYAEIPKGIDRLGLETLARDLVTKLVRRMAGPLVNEDAPLPHTDETWSGPAWSKKDFDELCRLPEDVSEAEYRRRYRAVGEGPDHALYFEKFGRRFTLEPPADAGPILKGGRPVIP